MINSAVFTLPDGGKIGYAEYGDPKGHPLFLLHGAPGSRLAGHPLSAAARECSVRLIAPDRPGYGLSTFRRFELLDYPHELLQLATHLQIERFSVMGMSSGLPYALACAYAFPQRIISVGAVSGLGPMNLPDQTPEMQPLSPWSFQIAYQRPSLFAVAQQVQTMLLIQVVKKYLWLGQSPIPKVSPETMALLIADQAEAFASGTQGVMEDARRLTRDWGFRLEDVNLPIYFWHGERDQHIPLPLAHYIVDKLPNCKAVFYPDEDHFQPALLHTQEIFQTLLSAETGEHRSRNSTGNNTLFFSDSLTDKPTDPAKMVSLIESTF